MRPRRTGPLDAPCPLGSGFANPHGRQTRPCFHGQHVESPNPDLLTKLLEMKSEPPVPIARPSRTTPQRISPWLVYQIEACAWWFWKVNPSPSKTSMVQICSNLNRPIGRFPRGVCVEVPRVSPAKRQARRSFNICVSEKNLRAHRSP